MLLYFVIPCVVLGILGAGIPIFFIFRNSRRNVERSLAAAMRRAGKAKVEIEGVGATLDPTSPKRKSGCALLTESMIIYVGHSGGEIVIPRDTITKVEIATPVLGSEEYGDTLLVSHGTKDGAGESELLRMAVPNGKKWMFQLVPSAADENTSSTS